MLLISRIHHEIMIGDIIDGMQGVHINKKAQSHLARILMFTLTRKCRALCATIFFFSSFVKIQLGDFTLTKDNQNKLGALRVAGLVPGGTSAQGRK